MHFEYEIRAVTDADSPDLARFLLDLKYFSALEGITLAEAERRVAANVSTCLADKSHSLYAAECGSALAGYVSVHWLPCLYMRGPEGFISELFVSESARGRGVGAGLLDHVIAEARERGCARLELINMKERESYRRGFYSKQGWEERPEAANFVFRL